MNKKFIGRLIIFVSVFFLGLFSSCLEPTVNRRVIYLDDYNNDNPVEKTTGVKKNLTLSYRNYGGGNLYQRVFMQLGNKETVRALETTITVDMTKVEGIASSDDREIWYIGEGENQRNTRAIIGLIFDLHQTKEKEEMDDYGKKVRKKYYDFVFIGYRPSTKSFYVEKYYDVPDYNFSSSSNLFAFDNEEIGSVEYLISKSGKSTSPTIFYLEASPSFVIERNGMIGKDDNGIDYYLEVPLQEITISITQEIPGTFLINVLGEEFEYTPEFSDEYYAKKWYDKDGYRIGGAGYFIQVPVDTEVIANFNSQNNRTIGL